MKVTIAGSVAVLMIVGSFGVVLPATTQAAEPTFAVSTVTIVPAPPSCDARSTKRIMTVGNATTIVWKSKHADSMRGLTQNDTEWPISGRKQVMIGFVGKHVFPLTFTGPGGLVTCTATVFVKPKKGDKTPSSTTH